MTTKQLTEFDHPAAWTVEGLLAQTDKWVYELTEDDLAELDTAFRQVKSKGLGYAHCKQGFKSFS